MRGSASTSVYYVRTGFVKLYNILVLGVCGAEYSWDADRRRSCTCAGAELHQASVLGEESGDDPV